MMSKGIKVDKALLTKAIVAFELRGGKLVSGQGLSRAEFRALERAGAIKKFPVYGKRVKTSTPPTMHYEWSLAI